MNRILKSIKSGVEDVFNMFSREDDLPEKERTPFAMKIVYLLLIVGVCLLYYFLQS